jgi:hypothetical protein
MITMRNQSIHKSSSAGQSTPDMLRQRHAMSPSARPAAVTAAEIAACKLALATSLPTLF